MPFLLLPLVEGRSCSVINFDVIFQTSYMYSLLFKMSARRRSIMPALKPVPGGRHLLCGRPLFLSPLPAPPPMMLLLTLLGPCLLGGPSLLATLVSGPFGASDKSVSCRSPRNLWRPAEGSLIIRGFPQNWSPTCYQVLFCSATKNPSVFNSSIWVGTSSNILNTLPSRALISMDGLDQGG